MRLDWRRVIGLSLGRPTTTERESRPLLTYSVTDAVKDLLLGVAAQAILIDDGDGTEA